MGVDVFFVISGYLITGIIARGLGDGSYSVLDFYERRARRILPALVAMVLASFAVGALALSPEQFTALAASALATMGFASNIWFWWSSAGYFGEDVHLAPLLHTWSLGVEEQFYIVFPVLLALAWRLLPRFVVPLTLIAAAASFAAACLLVPGPRASAAFFLLPPRAWELGLGALLALAPPRVPGSAWARGAIAFLALAGILAPVALYDAGTPFPGPAALPPVLGAAALIWVNGAGENPVRRLLAIRLFVGVGLISYSLYLWHWPVIVFAQLYRGALTPGLAAFCLALSVALAILSWRFVEQPFRSGRGLLPGRAALLGGSAAGMAAVALASLVVLRAEGFTSRLDPLTRATFAAAHDLDPRTEDCVRAQYAPGADRCRIGLTDRPRYDFLLWGDSHAAAALPGVDAAALRAGKAGYAAVRPACAPLLGVYRADQPGGPACARFGAEVIAFLSGRDDMPLVILDARWQLPSEGTVTGEFRPRPALLAEVSGTLPSGAAEDNFAIFEAGLRRTVAAVTATGRTVVVLGPVPEVGWHVPDLVGRARMLGQSPPAPPGRTETEARAARADALFRALEAEGRLRYLPLMPAFCAESCAILDARAVPLYRDDDHLNRAGALERIAPAVWEGLWSAEGIRNAANAAP